MKFQITVTVKSQKEGLELLCEYERLGFSEANQSNKFQPRYIAVRVSRNFAEQHVKLFNDIGRHELVIDASRTERSDWEDWGSHGMVLSQDNITEERVATWL